MVCLLAFIAGAVAAPLISQSWIWPAHWLLLTGLIGGALFLLVKYLRLPHLFQLKSVILWGSFVCFGAALALAGVNRVVAAQVSETWQGQDLTLTGTVVEVVSEPSSKITRIDFRVETAEQETLAQALKDRKVRLSWYYGKPIAAQQQWQLTVRLKRPRGFVNPRSFDYAAWLLSQQLVATGYIKDGQRLGAPTSTGYLQELRTALAKTLFSEERFSDAFFQALLLGEKRAITGEQWRLLKRTGTIHLMAISGLHVGLVAGLGFLVGWFLCRVAALVNSPQQPVILVRILPPLISCAAAVAYSALAGFSIPTQRALTVMALANLALFLGMRVNPLRLLALACLLVLFTSPLAPTQNGFWLSFLAVLVLVMGFAGRQLRMHPVFALVKAQWLLAIGLMAPLLGLGQTLSLVGPLANLIAVPLVSLVIVPGLLVAAATGFVFPSATLVLLNGLDWVFQLMWRYLAVLGGTASAQWWPSLATTSAMVLAVACAGIFIILPRGLYLRGLGILLLAAALLLPRSPGPALRVTALEVGQGLAVWIATPEHNLIYDTGPRFSADFDAGSRIVAPFLQTQGVRRVDTLMISHGDSDHSGGLEGLLLEMPVGRILVGDAARVDPASLHSKCHRGQHWQQGEVSFKVLWPPVENQWDRNDDSCVLLVELGDIRVLLTGDIGAAAEHRLLADGVVPGEITFLIAPHHGSKTSSSAAFVAHTQPESVIFSAGYQNRYGHPHRDVVKRYSERGTSIYNTGEDGALTFSWGSSQARPSVSRARQAINRAWH